MMARQNLQKDDYTLCLDLLGLRLGDDLVPGRVDRIREKLLRRLKDDPDHWRMEKYIELAADYLKSFSQPGEVMFLYPEESNNIRDIAQLVHEAYIASKNEELQRNARAT